MPNAVAGSSGLVAEITHSCRGGGSFSKECNIILGLAGEFDGRYASTSGTGVEDFGGGLLR